MYPLVIITLNTILCTIFILFSSILFNKNYNMNCYIKSFIIFIPTSIVNCILIQDFALVYLIFFAITLIIISKYFLNNNFFSSSMIALIFILIHTIIEFPSGIILKYLFNFNNLNFRENITEAVAFSITSFILWFAVLFILRTFCKKIFPLYIKYNKKHLIFILCIITAYAYLGISFATYNIYDHNINTIIFLTNSVVMCLFLCLSIISLYNSNKLLKTTDENIQLKTYISAIDKLQTELRTFRHNYLNVLTGLKGYLDLKDFNGLNLYINQILKNASKIRNTNAFDLSKVYHPALKGILSSKVMDAIAMNITLAIGIKEDIKTFNILPSHMCEIIGIILDNAIEECNNLKISDRKIEIIIDSFEEYNQIYISNTFKVKPNLNKIFNKGYSTKKGKNQGIGLYYIRNLIDSNPNLFLNTSINENKFIQELQIKKI